MPVADYSWDRPRPSELAKVYAGVVRYAPGRTDAVHITEDEVTALRGAGLLVAIVIQPSKDWVLGGHDAGVREATRSVEMTDAAGLPRGDVFVAVDFDATNGPAPHTEAELAQLETIASAFEGVASVVGQDHVRPYGGYHFLTWIHKRLPWLKPGWQPEIAWSLGPDGQPVVHPNAALLQHSPSITYDGAAIDHNDVLLPDWGQRLAPTGEPVPIYDDTRSDWNARPPLRAQTTVPWSERIGVSWHWIGPGRGPSASGSHQNCLEQVRDWQAQHQAKGWKDIGYNALICQHGRCIEGRGVQYSGSHSPGVNWEHVGIQFMVGEDTGHPPTAAMIARAQRLRADVGALGKNIRRDWGHKDDPEASTTCPGSWITNWAHTGGPTAYEGDNSMSAADVAELKDYLGKVLVAGYTVGDKSYPGIAAVDIENQRRIGYVRTDLAVLAAVVEKIAADTIDPEELAAIRAEARAGAAEGVKDMVDATVTADVDIVVTPKEPA